MKIFQFGTANRNEIQKKIEQKKDVSPTTTKNLCVQKLSWSCYQSKLKHHHNCNKKVWVHGCTVPQKPSLAALLNTVKESSSIDNTNMFDTYRRGGRWRNERNVPSPSLASGILPLCSTTTAGSTKPEQRKNRNISTVVRHLIPPALLNVGC